MATVSNVIPSTAISGSAITAGGWTTHYVNTNCQVSSKDTITSWNPLINNITMVIDTFENGMDLSLEYSPEKDISAYEAMCITMLLMALSEDTMGATSNILIFVRKHNLERHFKFKQ